MEEEKYFTLKDYDASKCYDDIKDNLGVVLYNKEELRKEEKEYDAIFVRDEMPGGMMLVLEVIIQEDDGMYYHIPVDTDMVVKEVLDTDEMFETGIKCMERKMPPIVEKATDLIKLSCLFEDPNFYIVHTKDVFGASVLFYNGMMKKLAKQLENSYFIMPLSRDLIIIAADDGTKDADRLQEILIEQNRKVPSEERLSDTILYYDMMDERLSTASEAKYKSNIVYLNETIGMYKN